MPRNQSGQRKFCYQFVAVPVLAKLFTILLLLTVERENNTLSKHSIRDYITRNPSDIQYSLGPVTQDDNGNIYLTGWCVRKGVTYRYYNYGLDF